MNLYDCIERVCCPVVAQLSRSQLIGRSFSSKFHAFALSLVLQLSLSIYSMDSQLAQLEIKHKITRWKQSDPDYVSAKIEESITSQKLIYASLRVSIVKRHETKSQVCRYIIILAIELLHSLLCYMVKRLLKSSAMA